MYFEPTAYSAEVPGIFNRLFDVVDLAIWQKRAEDLVRQVKQNPVLEPYTQERFALELEMGRLIASLMRTGAIPRQADTADRYRLLSFAATFVRTYQRLESPARNRLRGSLIGKLRGSVGISPLAFEMRIAAHLMARKFDVDFFDLRSGGGFDFLATRGNRKFEIECKHVSADIGRMIAQKPLHDLGGLLTHRIRDAFRDQESLFIRVLIPGRLPTSKPAQQEIVDAICHMIRERVPHTSSKFSITCEPFNVFLSPFNSNSAYDIEENAVRLFLENRFGAPNSSTIHCFTPGKHACIVCIQSETKDTVLKSIIENLLEDSKLQLTGSLPGALCVHLQDLTGDQLRQLHADEKSEPHGLQYGASHFLVKRPFVHTLAFMANDEIRIERKRVGDKIVTSFREVGPAYSFLGRGHEQGSNEIFGQEIL